MLSLYINHTQRDTAELPNGFKEVSADLKGDSLGFIENEGERERNKEVSK